MKVCVYNRYWSTAGGAEKFAGVIAEVLSHDHDVDLLAHEPIDLARLSERLRLDLTRVGVRVVPMSVGAVTEASSDYDLLVNASFLSGDPNGAKRGIYIVHFPGRVNVRFLAARRALARALGAAAAAHRPSIEWGAGWYPREGGVRGCIWSDGDGRLRVRLAEGQRVPVRLFFGSHRPAGLPPAVVAVEVDGRPAASVTLASSGNPLARLVGTSLVVPLVGRGMTDPIDVRVTSDHFVPTEHGVGDDRVLGVPLVAIGSGGPLRARFQQVFDVVAGDPVTFVSTYDVIASNSEFTRRWVKEWWGVDSTVLYPPVTAVARGDKEPIILGVGRFFAADRGHSKKQLEMVHAFRRLVQQGGADGWTLHLVGGCSDVDQPYLDEVQAAAAGLPVELHVNASGSELADLYARASLFWHATGLGEDASRHPDRQEHFGISTVEAMSAGAVPIVVRSAGQVEIVRHGIDGFHFVDLDELALHTAQVIADPELRARLSAHAEQRAACFGIDAFSGRLADLIDGLP